MVSAHIWRGRLALEPNQRASKGNEMGGQRGGEEEDDKLFLYLRQT